MNKPKSQLHNTFLSNNLLHSIQMPTEIFCIGVIVGNLREVNFHFVILPLQFSFRNLRYLKCISNPYLALVKDLQTGMYHSFVAAQLFFQVINHQFRNFIVIHLGVGNAFIKSIC